MSVAQTRTDAWPTRGTALIATYRWCITGGVIALVVGAGVWWLVLTDTPGFRPFLRQTLRDWGIWAPAIFMVLQALQVVVAPIPGEVTGILGGFLFGEWPGVLYSGIGTTLGSMAAFSLGRRLGPRSVRRLVSQETWDKMSFIVERKGAILCLIVYLVPGFPKDMACYLFGMSRMPLWLFVLASTVGRIPGTWVLSTQGAHAAGGYYLEAVLFMAIVTAAALPFYCFRTRIIAMASGRFTAHRSPPGCGR
jgi:uncharacterized membrane protein YdjX (TVP38/TMEM64 family)